LTDESFHIRFTYPIEDLVWIGEVELIQEPGLSTKERIRNEGESFNNQTIKTSQEVKFLFSGNFLRLLVLPFSFFIHIDQFRKCSQDLIPPRSAIGLPQQPIAK